MNPSKKLKARHAHLWTVQRHVPIGLTLCLWVPIQGKDQAHTPNKEGYDNAHYY